MNILLTVFIVIWTASPIALIPILIILLTRSKSDKPEEASIPAKPEAPPAAQQKQQQGFFCTANILLLLGVVLVSAAGIIFATGNWGTLTSPQKAVVISLFDLLFFFISWLSAQKMHLHKTSIAFYLSGSVLVPISILAIGYFQLFGPWFRMGNGGAALLYSLALWGFSIACFFGDRFFSLKLFAYLSIPALTASLFFLLHQFLPNGESVVLTVLFCLSRSLSPALRQKLRAGQAQLCIFAATLLVSVWLWRQQLLIPCIIALLCLILQGFLFCLDDTTEPPADKKWHVTPMTFLRLLLPWIGILPFLLTSMQLKLSLGYGWPDELRFFYFVILFTCNLLLIRNGNPRQIDRLHPSCLLALYGTGLILLILNWISCAENTQIIPYFPIYLWMLTVCASLCFYKASLKKDRPDHLFSPLSLYLWGAASALLLSVYATMDVFYRSVSTPVKLLPLSILIAAALLADILTETVPRFLKPVKTAAYYFLHVAMHCFLFLYTYFFLTDTHLSPFYGLWILGMILLCQCAFLLAKSNAAGILSLILVYPIVGVFLLRVFPGNTLAWSLSITFLFFLLITIGRLFLPALWIVHSVPPKVLIDWFHLTSILSAVYLFLGGRGGWQFFSLVLAAFYFLCFEKRIRRSFTPVLHSLFAFCLCMACWTLPIKGLPVIWQRQAIFAPLLLFCYLLYKVIWKRNLKLTGVLSWLFFCLMTFWTVNQALSYVRHGQVTDAAILATAMLIALFLSCVHKQKRWFFLASVSLVGLLFYTTRFVWGRVGWWAYLLAAGILLIAFASANEFFIRKWKSFKVFLHRTLLDWRW